MNLNFFVCLQLPHLKIFRTIQLFKQASSILTYVYHKNHLSQPNQYPAACIGSLREAIITQNQLNLGNHSNLSTTPPPIGWEILTNWEFLLFLTTPPPPSASPYTLQYHRMYGNYRRPTKKNHLRAVNGAYRFALECFHVCCLFSDSKPRFPSWASGGGFKLYISSLSLLLITPELVCF